MTCTRDGKVRAVSLAAELILDMIKSGSDFMMVRNCQCSVEEQDQEVNKQQISSFIQCQNFQHFNSKALKLEVLFSCKVIVSMASKYFILISGFLQNLLFQKLVLLKFQLKKKKLCLSLQFYQIAASVKQSFVGLTNMLELNSLFWFEISLVKNIPMDSI